MHVCICITECSLQKDSELALIVGNVDMSLHQSIDNLTQDLHIHIHTYIHTYSYWEIVGDTFWRTRYQQWRVYADSFSQANAANLTLLDLCYMLCMYVLYWMYWIGGSARTLSLPARSTRCSCERIILSPLNRPSESYKDTILPNSYSKYIHLSLYDTICQVYNSRFISPIHI
jgi:hypothetical protein